MIGLPKLIRDHGGDVLARREKCKKATKPPNDSMKWIEKN
jgi:hypothetical protein